MANPTNLTPNAGAGTPGSVLPGSDDHAATILPTQDGLADEQNTDMTGGLGNEAVPAQEDAETATDGGPSDRFLREPELPVVGDPLIARVPTDLLPTMRTAQPPRRIEERLAPVRADAVLMSSLPHAAAIYIPLLYHATESFGPGAAHTYRFFFQDRDYQVMLITEKDGALFKVMLTEVREEADSLMPGFKSEKFENIVEASIQADSSQGYQCSATFDDNTMTFSWKTGSTKAVPPRIMGRVENITAKRTPTTQLGDPGEQRLQVCAEGDPTRIIEREVYSVPGASPVLADIRAGARDVVFRRVEYPELAGHGFLDRMTTYENGEFGIAISHYPDTANKSGGSIHSIMLYRKGEASERISGFRYFISHELDDVVRMSNGARFLEDGTLSAPFSTDNIIQLLRVIPGQDPPDEIRVDFKKDFPAQPTSNTIGLFELRERGETYDETSFRVPVLKFEGYGQRSSPRNGQQELIYSFEDRMAGTRRQLGVLIDRRGRPLQCLIESEIQGHVVTGTLSTVAKRELQTDCVLVAEVDGVRMFVAVDPAFSKQNPEKACRVTRVDIQTANPRHRPPDVFMHRFQKRTGVQLGESDELSPYTVYESPIDDIGIALMLRPDGRASHAIAFTASRAPFAGLRELIAAAIQIFSLEIPRDDSSMTVSPDVSSLRSATGSSALIVIPRPQDDTSLVTVRLKERLDAAPLLEYLKPHEPEKYGRTQLAGIQAVPDEIQKQVPKNLTAVAMFESDEGDLVVAGSNRELFIVPAAQLQDLTDHPDLWKVQEAVRKNQGRASLDFTGVWRGKRFVILSSAKIVALRTINNLDEVEVFRRQQWTDTIQKSITAIHQHVRERPATDWALSLPLQLQNGVWTDLIAEGGFAVRAQGAAVNAWREIFSGSAVRSGRSIPVDLRFGPGGVICAYDLVTRTSSKETEAVLVPRTESGSPAGEIRIFNIAKDPRWRFASGSEIARHLEKTFLRLDVRLELAAGEIVFHSPIEGQAQFLVRLLEVTAKTMGIAVRAEDFFKPIDLSTSAMTIPHGSEAARGVASLLVLLLGTLDSLRPKPIGEIPTWKKTVSEKSLRVPDGKFFYDDTAPVQYVAIRVRSTQNGEDASHEILALNAGNTPAGRWRHNGNSLSTLPQKLRDGDRLTLVHDDAEGWTDIALLFAGGGFTVVSEDTHFEPYEKQIVYRTAADLSNQNRTYQSAQGERITDGVFSLDVELYNDFRTGELKVRRAALRLHLDPAALGLTRTTDFKSVSMPDDWRAGGEIVFAANGLGNIRFDVRLESGILHVTRLSDPQDVLEAVPENGTIVVASREHVKTLRPRSLNGPRGSRVFEVVDTADVAEVLALAALAGQPLTLGSNEVLAVERADPQDQLGEGEAGSGTENHDGKKAEAGAYRFLPTRRNRDGSRPIRHLYLRRKEYLVLRESLDGIGARLAEGPDIEEFSVNPPARSVLSALQIQPGENFLPTPDTLRWIAAHLTGSHYNPSRNLWPFPDGQPLTQRLEFETENGLVISIPVRFRHRLRNPFEMDCDDVQDVSTGTLTPGQRIETYVRGHPHTRRSVDSQVIYHEQGGGWRIYVMMADPLTGVHKSFNLALEHGAGIEDPSAAEARAAQLSGQAPPKARWLTIPAVFGLVNITEWPTALQEPEESLHRNENRYRRDARAAINQRILQVLGNAGPLNLPAAMRLGHARVERVGLVSRLAFATQDTSFAESGATVMEMTGLALDRLSHRLDFEEHVTLTEYTWVERRSAEGAVLKGVDGRPIYERTLLRAREFEHTLGQRRGIVRLTEIIDQGTPDVFEWNLMTGTLTRERTVLAPDDAQMGREGRDTLRIMRGLNLPVLDAAQWRTARQARQDATGERPAAQLVLVTPHPVPFADLEDAGILLPPSSRVRAVTDLQQAMRLLERFDPHGENAMPDVASVLTALAGRQRESHVLALDNGTLVVLPVSEREEHPYDYIPHTVADPVRGMGASAVAPAIVRSGNGTKGTNGNGRNGSAAGHTDNKNDDNIMLRWLVPNPEIVDGQEAPALRTQPYTLQRAMGADATAARSGASVLKTRLKFCEPQHAALSAIENWLDDAVTGGEAMATAAMPTGSGKTIVAAGAAEILELKGVWRKGDKVLIFANQEELMDQLCGAFGVFFPDKKISRVQAAAIDFSGDIVVMSVQTVTRRRFDLAGKIRDSLASGERLALSIFDEWHHGEADTWQQVVSEIRQVQADAAVLGLTATPRRSDPNIIVDQKTKDHIAQKILPGGRLIEITGVPIRHLKKPSDLDSSSDLMSSARHRAIMEAVEAHAVKRRGNPRELASTLFSANSVAHAISLAQAYREHFGYARHSSEILKEYLKQSRPLVARHIAVLGDARGAGDIISGADDIRQLIESRRAGNAELNGTRYDTLVAVISADLSLDIRRLILEAWKVGLIESVFTSGLGLEGSDFKHARNFVDAQATISEQLEAQKKGRLQRYDDGEIDRDEGRLVDIEDRVWIDVVDRLDGLTPDSGFRYLATMREAFGIASVIPRNTPWDIGRNRPWEEMPTHLELTGQALFHAKRHPGRGRADVEVVIDGQDEKQKPLSRTITLEQFVSDSVYPGEGPPERRGRRVMGYRFVEAVTAQGQPRLAPDPRRGVKSLEEWIRVLGLNRPPTHVGVNLGGDGFLLDDEGTVVKVSLRLKAPVAAASGGPNGPVYEMTGIRVILPDRNTPMRAEIDIVRADGSPGIWSVRASRHGQSVLHIRDGATGRRFFMMVSQSGELMLWSRRRREAEYLRMVAAPNRARDIRMDGRDYAPRLDRRGQLIHAESPTTREPEMDDDSPYDYHIKRVFGRQEGTSDRATSEEAVNELPSVRFRVGVDELDDLIVQGLGPTADEKGTGAYFPFGDTGEFACHIDEEKWVDVNSGKLRRGKVRIFFHRREQIKLARFYEYEMEKDGKTLRRDGDGKKIRLKNPDGSFVMREELVKTAPYAMMEFDSREEMIGPGARFRLARAHYHEKYFTDEYFTPAQLEKNPYNVLPSGADYLVYGGIGFAVGALNPATDLLQAQLEAFLEAALREAEDHHQTNAIARIREIYAALAVTQTARGVDFPNIARIAGLITLLERNLMDAAADRAASDPESSAAAPSLPQLPALFDARGYPVRRQLAALVRMGRAGGAEYASYDDLLK